MFGGGGWEGKGYDEEGLFFFLVSSPFSFSFFFQPSRTSVCVCVSVCVLLLFGSCLRFKISELYWSCWTCSTMKIMMSSAYFKSKHFCWKSLELTPQRLSVNYRVSSPAASLFCSLASAAVSFCSPLTVSVDLHTDREGTLDHLGHPEVHRV